MRSKDSGLRMKETERTMKTSNNYKPLTDDTNYERWALALYEAAEEHGGLTPTFAQSWFKDAFKMQMPKPIDCPAIEGVVGNGE